MVHADVQSLSFSFTFCHANESGMDSEIHALARTLDPLSVSLSLLWQMLVRAACRHRFASILFSCWLYFCLLSSCSTCRPWRCLTLAAQQRGAPGCRTTYAGTAIAGIRDFAATLLPARASSTPRRWIVVVVNIYLSTCLSVCLCTLQTLSLDRGRGRQRFGGAAFFALVDVGTLHTDAALSPSRQCFDQR